VTRDEARRAAGRPLDVDPLDELYRAARARHDAAPFRHR
jgi:hypothetical protein